jgi:hypothetical protein
MLSLAAVQIRERLLLLLLLPIAVGLVLAAAAPTARASLLTQTVSGDGVDVQLVFDDASAGPGEIEIRIEVSADPNIGDLRGVFLDIADDTLLSGLSATGADVVDARFAAMGVSNLGNGANVNGDGPCPCDLGVEFGSAGIGTDDIRSTSFVLAHTSMGLSLSQFSNQTVAVRLTSVGLLGGARNDSSKIAGLVPEPGTAALFGLGLGALAARRRATRT